MKVEVRTLPTYHVAYVRHLEGYEEGEYNEKITEAFNKAAAWVGARNLFSKDTLCMGIFYDYGEITPAEKRRYDAAFTVPEHVRSGTGEIGIQDIPGGQYAVCRIEVENVDSNSFSFAISEMARAFDYMYGEWLPNSGYQLEDKPCLEMYLTPDTAPTIIIEACLPVKPL